MSVMHEIIEYKGWPDCIRLYNSEIELIATTDVGPRIVKVGFIGEQNFLYLVPEHEGKTGGDDWRIYGGHRLWHAPEAMPRSYAPDNEKIEYAILNNGVKLIQAREPITGIVKEMEINLSPHKNEVTVIHRLTNQNLWEIELSVWPITMLAQHGRAIIPQEPYGPESEFLLPARSLALWHFTKMNDPRWVWGEKYIQAKQDPRFSSDQKIGVKNKSGWAAYVLNGELLIKYVDFIPDADYPDYGCNNEIYINGNYLEIETLSPLTKVPPGGTIEHTERWLLARVTSDENEDNIDKNILPLV